MGRTGGTLNNNNCIIVDADDFCEANHDLGLIASLKSALPRFKMTLFAIPALCSAKFLEMVNRDYPYLELVPHGWSHPHPRECQHWDAETMNRYLDRVETLGWERGWKAPGWQISDESYLVLSERGYWLADQPYNRSRRPPGLRVYEVDSPNKIHAHIGHWNGGHNANALELIYEDVLRAGLEDPDFRFISEVMQS